MTISGRAAKEAISIYYAWWLITLLQFQEVLEIMQQEETSTQSKWRDTNNNPLQFRFSSRPLLNGGRSPSR